MNKPNEQETQRLEVTPEQARLLQDVALAAQRAQEIATLTLRAITAGRVPAGCEYRGVDVEQSAVLFAPRPAADVSKGP